MAVMHWYASVTTQVWPVCYDKAVTVMFMCDQLRYKAMFVSVLRRSDQRCQQCYNYAMAVVHRCDHTCGAKHAVDTVIGLGITLDLCRISGGSSQKSQSLASFSCCYRDYLINLQVGGGVKCI